MNQDIVFSPLNNSDFKITNFILQKMLISGIICIYLTQCVLQNFKKTLLTKGKNKI